MRRALFVTTALLFLAPTAAPLGLGLAYPIVTDGRLDLAILAPFDPRSEALAARDGPEPARFLYDGHLAGSGASIRFVAMGETGLALVGQERGLAWYALEEGILVPFTGELPVIPNDVELAAPEELDMPISQSQDGVLQIALDGDDSFRRTFGANADEEQLALAALMDAIYTANLGIRIEVVSQHVWTEATTLSGRIECDDSPSDLLRQTRVYYESTDPTTSSLRESLLLFSTKLPAPHPNGGTLIGCAYIEGLENAYAYATVRIRGTVATTPIDGYMNTVLTAHELGHNFAGHHHRATPTPDGLLDMVGCTGATIMYPYLCQNAPAFSEGEAGTATLWGVGEIAGIVQDGGNHGHMERYARDRI